MEILYFRTSKLLPMGDMVLRARCTRMLMHVTLIEATMSRLMVNRVAQIHVEARGPCVRFLCQLPSRLCPRWSNLLCAPFLREPTRARIWYFPKNFLLESFEHLIHSSHPRSSFCFAQANHGKRPCSHVGRRQRRRRKNIIKNGP